MSTRVRCILLCAIVAVTALAPAGDSDARSRSWKVLTWAAGPVVSDGSRYAAYDTPTGITRILDSAHGTWSSEPTPEGYRLEAVGGGQLLWGGPSVGYDAIQSVILLDLKTRVRHLPVGFDAYQRRTTTAFGAWTYFDRVGRFGLSGRAMAYHSGTRVLYNWHTGAVTYSHRPPFDRPEVLVDLDKPHLRTRLCRGIRQRTDPRGLSPAEDSSDDTFLPLEFDHRYGLGWAGRRADRLELARCGSRHRKVLTSVCPLSIRPCAGHQLGAGIATWAEIREVRTPTSLRYAGVVQAYDIASGKRWSWRRLEGINPGVVHTRNRVLVSTWPPGRREQSHPYVVRTARIPDAG